MFRCRSTCRRSLSPSIAIAIASKMPPRGSQEPSGSSAHQDDPFIDSAASHSVSENFPNSWSSDESPAPESSAPSSTTSSPMILYQPPTILSLLRGAAINLFLPFMNGLMLGFGELFAHEVAYRLGWSNTRVCTCIFSVH